MRPFSSLVSLEDAKSIILENTKPLEEQEGVPIENAHGRAMAEDIKAEMDVPPFARSAMDGFAVIAEDTFGAGEFSPKTLKVIGVVRAGDEPSVTVGKGEAAEVATGAVLPEGADAVVIVEKTEAVEGGVSIFSPVHPQENVSPAGSDIVAGTTVLRRGEVLHHGKIGVLAALGIEQVIVFRKPHVTIVPTGDEVCELSSTPSPSQVYDVNSYTLMSLAGKNGCDVERHLVVEDTMETIGQVLDNASKSDCIVFSGGSSVGERDVLVDVVADKGKVLFHGVQIKPGKPTLFGRIDKQLVFGLPGYPAACLTVGHVLLAPALRRMASLLADRAKVAKYELSKRVVSTLGRHQFLTVRIEDNMAVPVFKESGAITSLGHAEGYIQIPTNVDFLEKGDIVEVTFF